MTLSSLNTGSITGWGEPVYTYYRARCRLGRARPQYTTGRAAGWDDPVYTDYRAHYRLDEPDYNKQQCSRLYSHSSIRTRTPRCPRMNLVIFKLNSGLFDFSFWDFNEPSFLKGGCGTVIGQHIYAWEYNIQYQPDMETGHKSDHYLRDTRSLSG